MKPFTALFVLFIYSTTIFAQKPPLDTSILGKWPHISQILISDDGKYSLFILEQPQNLTNTLSAVANTGKWRINITGVRNDISFSNDSRLGCFINQKDSLGIIRLGTNKITYVPNISSYALAGRGVEQFLVYLAKTSYKQLTVQNTATYSQTEFANVEDYWCGPDGQTLAIKVDNKKDTFYQRSLLWHNLKSGKTIVIWQGIDSISLTFNKEGHKLAFIAILRAGPNPSYCIFLFAFQMKRASCLVTNESLEKGYLIVNYRLQFSKNSETILFASEKEEQAKHTKQSVYSNVTIWNYKDRYMQSDQNKPHFPTTVENDHHFNVVHLNNGKVIQLNDKSEQLIIPTSFDKYLIAKNILTYTSFYDTLNYHPRIRLVSTIDGKKNTLIEKQTSADYYLSPDDRFFVWFDQDSLAYFSYDLSSCKTKNISSFVPFNLIDTTSLNNGRLVRPFGKAYWRSSDQSICVYDEFDIWKLDLLGSKRPINLTNGYGRKNNIILRTVSQSMPVDELSPATTILLEGYNSKTKSNGFGLLSTNKSKDPGNFKMELSNYFYVSQKAKHSNIYLLVKETAKEFPNLFVTSNFKTEIQLSNFYPENDYNWLTAELMMWKLPNGNVSQGILYKPQNFDSTKQYPVIFNYYETKSNQLHDYLSPEFSNSDIDVPYFVSNGYLVFKPDIHFVRNHIGKSAVNSVVSAAKYLSTFYWVDSSKLGIQAHSFGGWITNFLVTHTNCFAAACTAAGVSDQISVFAQGSANYQQEFLALSSPGSAYGRTETPWTSPNIYVENSPIFSIASVTTPLLIIQGTEDPSVPYLQGLEMYIDLRRAGKKVWLLQYEKAGHILYGDDAKDCTIRMKQFFDYYLKGNPPAKWLTQGITAATKNFNTGLEIDSSGRQP